MTQRGLEIVGVGLIDIDSKECISLQAVQTPDSQTLESRDVNLLDWYLLVIKSMQNKLREVSLYIVAALISYCIFQKSLQSNLK